MEARQTLYKKYKRAVNGLDGAEDALSAITVGNAVSGVAVLSTVVLTLVGIALEGLAAVCGTATFAGRVVSRRLDKKAEKHDHNATSAETVLQTISLITNRALRDGNCIESESQLVLREAELFASFEDDIRSQRKRALREQTREIEAQLDAARARGHEEGIQLGRIDALKKNHRQVADGDSR